jgi:hypothetical protein
MVPGKAPLTLARPPAAERGTHGVAASIRRVEQNSILVSRQRLAGASGWSRAAQLERILSTARSRRRGSSLLSISITTPSARATTTAISSNAFWSRSGLAHVSFLKSETGTPSSFAAAATLAWCFVSVCSTSVRSRPTQLAGTFGIRHGAYVLSFLRG